MGTLGSKIGAIGAIDAVSVSVSHPAAVPPEVPSPVKVEKLVAESIQSPGEPVIVTLGAEEQIKAASPEKEVEEGNTDRSFDEARKIAEDLQRALNNSRETVIRFKASASDAENSSQFKFQVVDKDTGEVVRQFPPEDMLGLAHRMKADLAGLVFDASA